MISSDGNKLIIEKSFEFNDLRRTTAAFRNIISKKSYEDIVLDFQGCTSAFPGPILGVCSLVRQYREDNIEFDLILPAKDSLKRLFVNANWAHIIDPVNNESSTFKGLKQIPATQFLTFEEQESSVSRILDKIISSLEGFTREDLAAIEWSINEIMDNVINHSESSVGGFVQLSTFQRNRKRVEYVVCDSGVGIPKTLRPSKPQISSDADALDHAIREGVTKNSTTNQGNGLFGAFEISRVSEGYIEIHSGFGSLFYNKAKGLHVRTEQVPIQGTIIVGCIDYSNPGLLASALKFGGKKYCPIDYIEVKFEDETGDRIVFEMIKEARSFGSRKSAEPIAMKLKNFITICRSHKIFIDFKDVPVISSSFADEVFGKMFVEIGPIAFVTKFEFINISDTVASLIDRAILLRCGTVH